MPIRHTWIGATLYGYCNGFGDGTYGDKRVEAQGYDWLVVRELEPKGYPELMVFDGKWLDVADETIESWTDPERSHSG